MFRYMIRRILFLVPVILSVMIIIFTILYFTPGDPAQVALGQEGGPGAGKNGGDGFSDFPGIPGPGRIDDKSFHDGSFVPTASRNAKNDSRAAGMS